MVDDSQTGLEEALNKHLLAAVMEVKQLTHAGVQGILERIQSVGGLQAAKEKLRSTFFLNRSWDRPSDYFWAAKRVGRMDLSIEAIVLEPQWTRLFTSEELDRAASRLTEEGFNPPLDQPPTSEIPQTLPARVHSPFTQMSLVESRGYSFEMLMDGEASCDAVRKMAAALGERQRPSASPVIRKHLNDCRECRKQCPDLAAAYEHFDQEALGTWVNLLEIFQASLKLGDADLKRFMLMDLEDYEEPGEYADALDAELHTFIRPLCSWRAVRLGCHIGRFMSAFANTFAEPYDLWLKVRNGEVRGPISAFIRSVDRDLFILGLAARNLLLVRYWPKDEDEILWLPTDGDLTSVPGLVQVDELTDLNDWEEVLGKPPEDLNLLGALYLAQQTAIAQIEAFENKGTGVRVLSALQEQLDRIELHMRHHQTSLDDMRATQNAATNQLEHMVAYMSSAERHACEQTLLTKLCGVYEKLEPQVRSLLLAGEQVYRTPHVAAPAMIVQALATAFETQARCSILAPLLAYLKFKGIKKLMPPAGWSDTDMKRPVFRSDRPAEKFTLGGMERLLRHPESAIDEFFDLAGLTRTDVREALAEVQGPRNDAAHGRSIDIGTAEAIREDWLHWRGRSGGIFAVLFICE